MRKFIDMVTENSGHVRVIPRDLFNEGNLLKCYGAIYINLETMDVDAELHHNGGSFRVVEDESDGSGAITLANVILYVRGEAQQLFRPLNARGSYPLILRTEDWEEIDVFTESGSFSPEMIAYLRGDDA